MAAGSSARPQPPLAAAGSLPRPPDIAQPGLRRRMRLAAEILLLYAALPLAAHEVLTTFKVPVFLLLPPLLAAFAAYLLWDRSFRLARELSRGIPLPALVPVLAFFLAGGGGIALWVAGEMPQHFLSLPRQRPELWMKLLLLYPFLSVIPQEFLYRTFFFHRYGPLFGRHHWLLIATNALLFGAMHIIFRNWLAVAGTVLGGVLFAWRYARTGSFWTVCLEHTLWGWLVFTVGLGRYFFTGIANPL